MRHCVATASGVVTASGLIAHGAYAAPYPVVADNDNVHVFLSETVSYDNNLYRVSDDFGPLSVIGPGVSRDDTISRASLGADGHVYLGRQTFTLKGRVDDNRFRENDHLDHTSGAAAALWDWQLGNRFSGSIGAEYARTLADFAYVRTFEKDLIDREDYYANARIRVTPRWSLTGEGRTSRTEHTADESETDNTTVDTWKAGVMYETPRMDSFGFDYIEKKTTSPDEGPLLATIEQDHISKSGMGWIKYVYSPKTQFDLRLGYEKAEYDGISAGEFSGTTGRATVRWEPTVKTQFTFAIWREINAYQEASSEYFETKGVSLNSAWQPTDKFGFGLVLSREDNDFPTDTLVPISASSREGVTTSGTLSANYYPREYLDVGLSVKHVERDSDRVLQDYDADIVAVSLRLKF